MNEDVMDDASSDSDFASVAFPKSQKAAAPPPVPCVPTAKSVPKAKAKSGIPGKSVDRSGLEHKLVMSMARAAKARKVKDRDEAALLEIAADALSRHGRRKVKGLRMDPRLKGGGSRGKKRLRQVICQEFSGGSRGL